MISVDIISKIVNKSTGKSATMVGGESNVDLSAYLRKEIWEKVWEIKTDEAGNEYIFGKLPVVTQYGVTMYAGDTVNIPSIYDGLPIDNSTLVRDTNGVLMVNPDIELGGASSWDELEGIPSWIGASKPVYQYSEIKNTPDLSKYVSSEELKKYVTLEGNETITGLKDFTKGIKIDGLPITKLQDDVIYIDGNLVVRGGVTMYGENEVDIPTLMDAIAVDATMYNEGGILGVVKASTTKAGAAMFDSNFFSVDDNGLVTLTNAPSSVSTLGSLLNVDVSIDSTATVNRVLYQAAGSSTWTWKELTSSGVVGDYLPLSGGTLTGFLNIKPPAPNYASTICYKGYYNDETWGYIGYDTVDRVRVYDSNGSGLGVITTKGISINWDDLWTDIHGQTHPWYGLHFQPNKLDVFTTTFSSYYGMQLKTAQASISITESGNVGIGDNNPIYMLDVYGSSRSMVHVFFSAMNHDVRGGFIGCGSPDSYNIQLIADIGDLLFYTRGTLAMTLTGGNLLTYGGITMYSDIRKKQKLQDVELSLSQIANAPLIEHYYLSDKDKTTHVGSIAQYWAGLNDWFCKKDAEGFYTMEIQNAALASAISIARHLERYESKTDKKIRQLKKRICQLESELEILKNEGGYLC